MERFLYTVLRGPHRVHIELAYVETCLDGSGQLRTRCALCNTGWMEVVSSCRHFNGSRHARQYDQLLVLQRAAMKKKIVVAGRDSRHALVQGIQREISFLSAESNKEAGMRECLYRFVMDTSGKTCFDTIGRPFAKLIRHEVQSLVCLAAIKSIVCRGRASSLTELRQCEMQVGDTSHDISVASITAAHMIATCVMSFVTVVVSGSVTCCVADHQSAKGTAAHTQKFFSTSYATTTDPRCSHDFFFDSVLASYPLCAPVAISSNIFVLLL